MQYTFTLTEPEANTVLGALGRLPYADVFLVVEKLRAQAKANQSSTNDALDIPPQDTSEAA